MLTTIHGLQIINPLFTSLITEYLFVHTQALHPLALVENLIGA